MTRPAAVGMLLILLVWVYRWWTLRKSERERKQRMEMRHAANKESQ